MKKKYIGIIAGVVCVVGITLVILFGGIGSGADNAHNSTPPADNTTTPQEPPDTSNWISPGKLFVDAYEPGHTVELQIQVHNGNDVPTVFSVDYRYPDNLSEGYVKPAGASDWVRVKTKFPTLGAYETYTATLWLYMPETAESPGDKWEFWIGVVDQSQTGMVVTELCTRVLVTMK